jgi:hypothetical protein
VRPARKAPAGTNGVTTVTRVAGNVVTSTSTVGDLTGASTATCTGNSKLVGGGATIAQTGNRTTGAISRSEPSSTTVNGSWTAQAVVVTKSGSNTFTLQASALCAS